ncbi:MAG: DUF4349 domain-containing protein [Anaerolineae bacterium]
MKRLPIVLLLLLSLLLAACAAAPAMGKAAEESVGRAAVPPAQPAAEPAADAAGYGGEGAPALAGSERKVILTANLQLVVQNTEETVATIKSMVNGQGGFIAGANVWREGNLLRAQMTVRIPADKMEPFLAEVRKLAVRVEREDTSGQDVTEEYVDLAARLRNLEAAETELRTLLAEVRESSGKAEDIMAVYRELENVRGQIEQIKGRMQYIDRSVDLATVTLNLSERAPEPIGQPGWQPLQTVRRALNALVEIAKFLVEASIWILLVVIPLLAVPAFFIWLLIRLLRRHPRTPAG